MRKKTEQKSNKLYNVASARLSKSKEYVNFCLITSKDDKKEFATICKKKEDCKFSKGTDGKYYVYFIVELKKEEPKQVKTAEEITDEDLPF